MRPTISVVVPCYPPHQKYISSLLKQLNRQTEKPNEIIIALSEIEVEDAAVLKEQWIKLTDIELQVVSQPWKALAAVNRNFGAAHAIHDYIQFLDADDTYHTHLISTIRNYIDEYRPDAILYHLSEEEIDIEHEPIKKRFYTSEELFNIAFPTKLYNPQDEHYNNQPQLFAESSIHHGHLCVKYSVWNDNPQEDLEGREDSVYIRTLLWNWHQGQRKTDGVIAISEVLTYYRINPEKILEQVKARFAKIDELEAQGVSCEIK